MKPRAACFACIEQHPPALFEAALWVAAEHQRDLKLSHWLAQLKQLQQQISIQLPHLPASELAQPMLRCMAAAGFHQDDDWPLQPRTALLHEVLKRRRGQPLSLALIALEIAKGLGIPLQGVAFPGYFLLRVPGADHLLDPCNGRRLYTRECRELLQLQLGAQAQLNADYLASCSAAGILQRLSRNLRHLHLDADNPLAALQDAERALQLGEPTMADHLARAEIYQHLDCPQGARFDLQRALLLCTDPLQHLEISQQLRQLRNHHAVH